MLGTFKVVRKYGSDTIIDRVAAKPFVTVRHSKCDLLTINEFLWIRFALRSGLCKLTKTRVFPMLKSGGPEYYLMPLPSTPMEHP
jgi:hypothetical protein